MSTLYTFNLPGDFPKAQGLDINASYKDLAEVCNAIRYNNVGRAMETLDSVISMQHAIPFRRYNKYLGARHELGGRKGAYPVNAAKAIRVVLQNAMANAVNKGEITPEQMVIIHANANKMRIEKRGPSKGSLSWGRGMYGRSAAMHSNIEYSRVEIVLGKGDEEQLTKNMRYFIKKNKQVHAKPRPAAKKEEKAKKPLLPFPTKKAEPARAETKTK